MIEEEGTRANARNASSTCHPKPFRNVAYPSYSGQGGNQSLSDCADALQQILRLHSSHQENPASLTNLEFEKACLAYERAMIPRAFAWVTKSGGTTIPVSKHR